MVEWKSPTAMTIWTIGTGLIGGIASIILAKRIEKEGIVGFDSGKMFFAILGASALNIYIASVIKGN